MSEDQQQLTAEETARCRAKREKTRKHYRLEWKALDPACAAGGTFEEHRSGACACTAEEYYREGRTSL